MSGGSNIVVLDRLQDPGNIGTIIRTAEGAGYAAVFALKGTADIFHRRPSGQRPDQSLGSLLFMSRIIGN